MVVYRQIGKGGVFKRQIEVSELDNILLIRIGVLYRDVDLVQESCLRPTLCLGVPEDRVDGYQGEVEGAGAELGMAGFRSSVAIENVTMTSLRLLVSGAGMVAVAALVATQLPPRFGRCRCRGVRRAPGGIWDLRRQPIRRRCGSRWSCSCGCWMCGWSRCGGRRGCR